MTKPETDPTAQAGVTITDAMVEAAEAAIYPRHERGFLLKPLIDAIDMRAALQAALAAQPAQTTEAVGIKPLAEDLVLLLLRKNFDTKTQRALTYTQWKDGIDVYRASGPAMAFVRDIIEAASTLAPAPPSTGAEPALAADKLHLEHSPRDKDALLRLSHYIIQGGDTFTVEAARTMLDLLARYEAALKHALAAPAPQEQVSERYTPKIIHFDGEGDPHWEFVERDCPTITDLVFAANVEKLLDADHNLIGFRIYDPASPVAAVSEREAYAEIVKEVSDNFRADLDRIMAENPPSETGWLVELRSKIGPPTWWSLTDTQGDGGYFTADSLKALRFARKEDAQACIEDAGWTECTPTEHEWVDTIRSLARPRTTGGQG